MSQSGTEDDDSELPGATPTVTSDAGMQPNGEMNVIGMAIFAGMLVVMLPVLPLAALGWVVMKLFG
jgi:hypothetical protein